MQGEVVDPHGQRGLRRQHLLVRPLEHGLVLGLEVDADDPGARQPGTQLGQQLQHAATLPGRAQDEADHELTVGGVGHQHVLELALAARYVIGRQTGLAQEVGQRQDRLGQARFVEAAPAQVHAPAVAVEDADGGSTAPAAHGELGLVAEAHLAVRLRRAPGGRRDVRLQAARCPGLLVRQLPGVRGAHEGARATGPGVVVVALHRPRVERPHETGDPRRGQGRRFMACRSHAWRPATSGPPR
ncbi:hypothetical protein [Ornithinimicrobium kibberense]|uniref:hypothetical protein n=1 Tax=Ornithinimicrobium kibberense TaxID=282060 RepID=UPI00361FB657